MILCKKAKSNYIGNSVRNSNYRSSGIFLTGAKVFPGSIPVLTKLLLETFLELQQWV